LVFVHDGVLYTATKENYGVNEVNDVQFTILDLKELKSGMNTQKVQLFTAQRRDV